MVQKRIITIGSALVDVFISSDQFEISRNHQEIFTTRSTGGKLSVDSFKIKTGGGGGNTAAGFAKMGFEASCIAELGADELAQIIVADLTKHGVRTDLLIQERKEETGGSVLLVAQSGERTALVHRGAAAMLDPHDIPESALSKQDWIHLSSVAGRTQTIEEIFRVAVKYSIGMSWNPGQAELEALKLDVPTFIEQARSSSKHPVQVLLVNHQEWEFIAPLQESLKQIISYIVVTNSIYGGVVYERIEDDGNQVAVNQQSEKFTTKIHEYLADKVTSVDNTGAGDAFAVGFVSAQLYGHDVQTAINWGKKNSGSVVQKPGAKNGLLSLGEIA